MADLHSNILDAAPGVQILSISCRFWEILTKSYVGARGGLAPPPRENSASATDYHINYCQTDVTAIDLFLVKSIVYVVKNYLKYTLGNDTY